MRGALSRRPAGDAAFHIWFRGVGPLPVPPQLTTFTRVDWSSTGPSHAPCLLHRPLYSAHHYHQGRMSTQDEAGVSEEYKNYPHDNSEREALLPLPVVTEPAESPRKSQTTERCTGRNSPLLLSLAFLGGALTCIAIQYVAGTHQWLMTGPRPTMVGDAHALAPPYVGSTEIHNFPPSSPTNVNPSLFPTEVGYAGPTPTGAEPALIATAPSYPIHSGAAHLVSPEFTKPSSNRTEFNLFRHWGNLSPWFSVGKGAFGLDTTPEPPETCSVTGLHFLHRHGARYPTGWGKHTVSSCTCKHCSSVIVTVSIVRWSREFRSQTEQVRV